MGGDGGSGGVIPAGLVGTGLSGQCDKRLVLGDPAAESPAPKVASKGVAESGAVDAASAFLKISIMSSLLKGFASKRKDKRWLDAFVGPPSVTSECALLRLRGTDAAIIPPLPL